MPTAYDADVIAWSEEQAVLLRAGRFDQIDIEHIADEVESVGRSERKELENRMAVLLAHLLKWSYQPGLRGKSWRDTIDEQRHQIANRLDDAPSLKPLLSDAYWRKRFWENALWLAYRETGIPRDKFPAAIPWDMESEILNPDFLPPEA